jgi:hypothetical protein
VWRGWILGCFGRCGSLGGGLVVVIWGRDRPGRRGLGLGEAAEGRGGLPPRPSAACPEFKNAERSRLAVFEGCLCWDFCSFAENF